jgi:hypothetical protein
VHSATSPCGAVLQKTYHPHLHYTRTNCHLHCFAFAVKWVALLYIREVLGSYPGPQAALWTGGFRDCTRFLQTNAEIVPKIRPRPIPSASFPISNQPIRTSRYVIWVRSKAAFYHTTIINLLQIITAAVAPMDFCVLKYRVRQKNLTIFKLK